MSSFDLYQTVTQQIITMLENGVVPWRSPILGLGVAGLPRNRSSNKPYRGVNVFLLSMTAFCRGYSSAYWMTFNQARDLGGTVRKGEKSSMVVFWKTYDTTDRTTGDPTTVPVLRYYNVFNAEQVDGLTVPDAAPFTPSVFAPIEQAEQIVQGYASGPAIETGGTRAYYRPSTDTVRMPEPTRFTTPEEFYSTKFHELAHSTGHSSRLDRKLDTELQPFGSSDYSREELIAEMAAAFLSARAGISPAVIHNQAAYLSGWIQQLKGDKRLAIAAAGAAQRAADWILGERQPEM